MTNQITGNAFNEAQPQRYEKKHRTTTTQRQSFKALNESGKRETQARKVLTLLLGKPPLTSRQISTLTGYERTNITRCIRDLQDSGRVKIAYCAKCATTGITVEHYTPTGLEAVKP